MTKTSPTATPCTEPGMGTGAATMNPPDRRAGIRRTVLALVLVALAIYAGFLAGLSGR